MKGNVGDRIVVESERAGQSSRTGVIEEVLQEDPPRYEVRWENGRKSILAPSAGSTRIELDERGSPSAESRKALPKQEESVQMSDKALVTGASRRKLRGVRIGALLAVFLASFFVAWLIIRSDVIGNEDKPAAPRASGGAVSAAEPRLKSLAASVEHPVYWAGPKSGHSYEWTRTADGRIYIRYLPRGVKPGDPHPRYLTIGTYPRARAFAELKRASQAEGALTRSIGRGGIMVYSEARPSSVYFGYPRARYQVEVYHPSPRLARRLVLTGLVVPVK